MRICRKKYRMYTLRAINPHYKQQISFNNLILVIRTYQWGCSKGRLTNPLKAEWALVVPPVSSDPAHLFVPTIKKKANFYILQLPVIQRPP